MASKVAIKIPKTSNRRLRQMIAGIGFSSVNEFIVLVMRTIASGGELNGEDMPTEKDVRAVRGRLKRLGYLKEKE